MSDPATCECGQAARDVERRTAEKCARMAELTILIGPGFSGETNVALARQGRLIARVIRERFVKEATEGGTVRSGNRESAVGSRERRK